MSNPLARWVPSGLHATASSESEYRRTYGNTRNKVHRLGEERFTQHGSFKVGILHLDALQIGPSNGKTREIQATQVPTKLAQQPTDLALSSTFGSCTTC